MLMRSDIRTEILDATKANLPTLNPDLLAEDIVQEYKRRSAPLIVGVTQTQTATGTSGLKTIVYSDTRDASRHVPWWETGWEARLFVLEGTPMSTKVSFLCSLLQRHRRGERIARMSPERRAIYEKIQKLREEIGPMNFDIVEALREIRADE